MTTSSNTTKARSRSDGPAAAAVPFSGRADWAGLFHESLRFLSVRLQEDLKAQRAFLECRDPADLLRVQSEFCLKAMEHYSAEALLMLDMLSGRTLVPAERRVVRYSQGYDDVPL